MTSKWKLTLVSIGKLEWYMHRFFTWVIKTIQKHKLNGEGMTIPGQAAETLFTVNKKKANKKLLKLVDKQITSQRRTLKTHFEDPEMGWDLDLAHIQGDILTDVLGFDVNSYIAGRLVRGRPLDILYTSGKAYIVKRKRK